MKTLIISTALIVASITHLNAQLYSSGNNAINGNNVGIGTSSPTTKLEVKSSFNPNQSSCLNCPPPGPHSAVRLNTQLLGTTNPTNHYWDVGGAVDFSISHKINSGNVSTLLKLNNTDLEVQTEKAILTPHISFASTSQFGQSAVMTLGTEYNHYVNGFSSISSGTKGVAFIAQNNGNLEIKTGCDNQNETPNALFVSADGDVGIGTNSPSHKLEIDDGTLRINDGRLVISDGSTNQFEVKNNGYVVAREILVDISEAIPDYVFDDDYELMPMDELKVYLESEHHLPNIPSATEFDQIGGIEVGELSRLLLEKQEELVLYILELEERISELENSKTE